MEVFVRLAGLVVVGVCLVTTVASSATRVADPAPDFALTSTEGENLRISEYRSEIVVLNFWASWCRDCRRAVPVFKTIDQRYGAAGVNVLSVAVEGQEQEALELINKFDLEFPVLLDQRHEASRLYELGRLPHTVVIDREGNVTYVEKGFRNDSAQRLLAVVDELVVDQ